MTKEIEICSACNINPSEPDSCPYSYEIDGEDIICDCCESCREECGESI